MKKNNEEALYKWFRNAQNEEIMKLILKNRDSYPNCMKVINSHCEDYLKKFRRIGVGDSGQGNGFDQNLVVDNEDMVFREEREEIYKEIPKWIDLKKSLKSAFISDIYLIKV